MLLRTSQPTKSISRQKIPERRKKFNLLSLVEFLDGGVKTYGSLRFLNTVTKEKRKLG